jgi:GrpB-like predicted nucleotidyltransferase (UPF0157 family)/ribosomal protein S18 acetylase RimI-like enzyme
MVTKETTIRAAKADDVSALHRLLQLAFAQYRDKLDPPSGAFRETEEKLHSLLWEEKAAVAIHEGRRAGCVFYDTAEDFFYFHRLAVLPNFRRRGIGRRLIAFVEEQAAEMGRASVRLCVRTMLPETRRYYERSGYRVIALHSHPNYKLPTYYVMERNLNQPADNWQSGIIRKIEVVPYDPAWPVMYEQEASILTSAFDEQLVAIHHIGSTAIVGIHAKPIIDILPVVHDIEQVNRLNPLLISLGYDPRGENGIAGRRYFRKGTDTARSHHVHVFEDGNPEIARHVDFCAFLNAFPKQAERYSILKQQLAGQVDHDIEAYLNGKGPLIQELDERASAWRKSAG